ncbi:MAG: acetyl-CoA carboxylase biotin carboxyl carrier protein [Sinomicrobium sp.]|nr:acetyl-CoA carboxylase biotin carboxyl carrier protein [Sinomicrobium sp.]
MDLKEIQNLIKFVAKSGANEVRLEMGDVKITIKTGTETVRAEAAYVQQIPVPAALQQPLVQQQPQTAPQTGTKPPEENSKYITVKSPIIGTFYRRPSPDKSSFVEVGDTVTRGDVLCVIEAMKLFNEIESEVSGKIVKVLVEDSSPVEFDQPLFLIEPS